MLAVKDNQPKLHEAIKELFRDERQDDLLKMPHRQHQTSEKGHGPKDERCYVLAKIPGDSPLKNQWPGIKAVGMAVRMTEKGDGTTNGRRALLYQPLLCQCRAFCPGCSWSLGY